VKRKRKKKPQDENIMACPIPQGGHNKNKSGMCNALKTSQKF